MMKYSIPESVIALLWMVVLLLTFIFCKIEKVNKLLYDIIAGVLIVGIICFLWLKDIISLIRDIYRKVSRQFERLFHKSK